MALILVTGASSGVGLATVQSLADAGHDVVLHARHPDRLEDRNVRARMHDVVFGDLADLEQTTAVAEDANGIGRFDAVIHNAGINTGRDIFAVNVVAPYVLTALMAPPGRAIFLSSSMHRSGSTDLHGLDLSDASTRPRPYEDAKLYETALAMGLARLRPDALVHAVDPGWVPTRMGGRSAPDSLDEGHRTQEWLATADENAISPRTGGYWYHHATQQPHPAVHDPEFEHDLLQLLERHTGIAPAV